jgi:hypothetical protein
LRADPDHWLTQYGRHSDGFRRRPRSHETAVSLIRGRLTVAEAVRVVLWAESVTEDDRVRYARAAALLEHGFDVLLTPTRRNADHISVVWNGDWDDDVARAFDSCFEGADEESNDE